MKEYYFPTPKEFFQFCDREDIIGMRTHDGIANIVAVVSSPIIAGIARFIVDACNAEIARRGADASELREAGT